MTSTNISNDGLSNPFCYRDPGQLPGLNVVPSEDHGAMGRQEGRCITGTHFHPSSSFSNLYSTNRDNLHPGIVSQHSMPLNPIADTNPFGAGSRTSLFGSTPHMAAANQFGASGTFRFGNVTQPVVDSTPPHSSGNTFQHAADSSPQRSLDNTFQQVLGGTPHYVSSERRRVRVGQARYSQPTAVPIRTPEVHQEAERKPSESQLSDQADYDVIGRQLAWIAAIRREQEESPSQRRIPNAISDAEARRQQELEDRAACTRAWEAQSEDDTEDAESEEDVSEADSSEADSSDDEAYSAEADASEDEAYAS